MLREQEYLPARIDKPADGEDRIVFADVRIKEDGIPARIDHHIPA